MCRMTIGNWLLVFDNRKVFGNTDKSDFFGGVDTKAWLEKVSRENDFVLADWSFFIVDVPL